METYKLSVHTIRINLNLLCTQYRYTYKLIVHTIRIYCTHNTYKLIVHTIQIWKRINLLYTQYRYGNV